MDDLTELKKEFDNKHGSNIDEAFVRLGMKPYAYGVWQWIETAITKAKEAGREEVKKDIVKRMTGANFKNIFKELQSK